MKLAYDPRLDGLRAFSALLVLLVHVEAAGVPGGRLGVDVFFVLSGYLVTRILAAEHAATGRIDVARFLVRRARRLLPALFAMLAALLVFVWAMRLVYAHRYTEDVMLAATYTSDLAAAAGWRSPLVHTWSLAVEMKFYVLWPLALLALLRLPRPYLAAAGLWLAMTAARLLWGQSEGAYYRPEFHSTGLLLGAAMALRPPGRSSALGGVALAAIAALALSPLPEAVRPIPAELAAALVIASPPAVLGLGPLPWLGRLAYGTYLWHLPLLGAFRLFLPMTGWPAAVPLYVASLAAAALSYYTVERAVWRPPVRALAPA